MLEQTGRTSVELNPEPPKSRHRVSFTKKTLDPFSIELLKEKDKYFAEKKISEKAPASYYLLVAFYLGSLFGGIALILTGILPGWAAFVVACLIGLTKAGIGFSVAHDALHGSISKKRWVNNLIGHSMSFAGGNPYNWIILHNHIHHNYTNVAGADGDLEPVPILRFYPRNEGLKSFHKYQHIYAPFLYALTSFVWVFKKDFDHIFKTEHVGYKKPPLPRGEFTKMVFFKIVYLTLFLALPLLITPYPWYGVLAGFVACHILMGLSLALVFQMGHITEMAEHTEIPDEGPLVSWHRLQVLNSSNFGCSRFAAQCWFGGLNYQIEHHLFPRTHHFHYPALAEITERVAKKHGLPYNNYPSHWEAVKSHFRVLKACGRPVVEA